MDTDARRTLAMLFFAGIIGGAIAFGVGLTLRSGQQDEPVYASTPVSTVSDTASVAVPVAQNVANQISNTSPIRDQSGNLSSSFINKIEPSIFSIFCWPLNARYPVLGSGISYRSDNGTIYILSNYHVFGLAYSGGSAPFCFAFFPQPPNYSFNPQYGGYGIILDWWRSNPRINQDSARFRLGSPLRAPLPRIPTVNDAYLNLDRTDNFCSAMDAVVGDRITTFGYPNSGNQLGISETVTTGIISGLLPGPMYKTTAAIDHGNSGGIALLDKNGCLLGIPTMGSPGLTGGTGYIQSFILADQ